MQHQLLFGLFILSSFCWTSASGLAKGPGGGGGHGGAGHAGHGAYGRGYYHHGYGYGGFYGYPYGYGYLGFYGYDPGFYGFGVPYGYGYPNPYPLPGSLVPAPGIMVPGDPAAGNSVPGRYHPSLPPNGDRGLPVTIALKVPANAEVWFNGVKTTQTGLVRQFQSPPLEAGADFEYEIRVSWQESGRPITQTRHVNVRAGQNVNLEFKARIAPPQP